LTHLRWTLNVWIPLYSECIIGKGLSSWYTAVTWWKEVLSSLMIVNVIVSAETHLLISFPISLILIATSRITSRWLYGNVRQFVFTGLERIKWFFGISEMTSIWINSFLDIPKCPLNRLSSFKRALKFIIIALLLSGWSWAWIDDGRPFNRV
jgi:hypothetical protein